MGRRWAEHLKAHLRSTAEVNERVAEECSIAVAEAAHEIVDSLRAGGKLMICGNGGSAADSQHMAAELTCRLTADFQRPGLAAIALTTDTAFLTAYANDNGYEGVFARQVQALGKKGDVLFGISTSGASNNVRQAVREAKALGIRTIVLTGEGGPLLREADHAIVIPSRITAHVQEAMLPVEHVICHVVERELFPD
jgi:D-sedoheptulose 7-phosphate isomerase